MLPIWRFKFQLDDAAPVYGGGDSELRPASPNSITYL